MIYRKDIHTIWAVQGIRIAGIVRVCSASNCFCGPTCVIGQQRLLAGDMNPGCRLTGAAGIVGSYHSFMEPFRKYMPFAHAPFVHPVSFRHQRITLARLIWVPVGTMLNQVMLRAGWLVGLKNEPNVPRRKVVGQCWKCHTGRPSPTPICAGQQEHVDAASGSSTDANSGAGHRGRFRQLRALPHPWEAGTSAIC